MQDFKGNLFLWFFGLAVIVNLTSHLIGEYTLELISKPLLMPLLIGFVWINSKSLPVTLVRLLYGSLVFSWIGDVSLLFDSSYPFLFMVGLGGFLIAHIQYIILFIKSAKSLNFFKGVTPYIVLIMMGYTGYLIILLWPVLGELQIPVFVYAIVLMVMGVMATTRQASKGRLLVIFGAVFFVVSDSVLAINKFHHTVEYGRVLTMITYTGAQLLIVLGILKVMKHKLEA